MHATSQGTQTPPEVHAVVEFTLYLLAFEFEFDLNFEFDDRLYAFQVRGDSGLCCLFV